MSGGGPPHASRCTLLCTRGIAKPRGGLAAAPCLAGPSEAGCPHLRPVQRMTGPMEGALISSDSSTKAEAHSTTSKLASSGRGVGLVGGGDTDRVRS